MPRGRFQSKSPVLIHEKRRRKIVPQMFSGSHKRREGHSLTLQNHVHHCSRSALPFPFSPCVSCTLPVRGTYIMYVHVACHHCHVENKKYPNAQGVPIAFSVRVVFLTLFSSNMERLHGPEPPSPKEHHRSSREEAKKAKTTEMAHSCSPGSLHIWRHKSNHPYSTL